jgi:hypothetical protein
MAREGLQTLRNRTWQYCPRLPSQNYKTAAQLLSLNSPANETIATVSARHRSRQDTFVYPIARSCIRTGARARFYSVVDLNRAREPVTGASGLALANGRRPAALAQPGACRLPSGGQSRFVAAWQVHQVSARCRGQRGPSRHDDGTAPEQEFANRSVNLANRSRKYSR